MPWPGSSRTARTPWPRPTGRPPLQRRPRRHPPGPTAARGRAAPAPGRAPAPAPAAAALRELHRGPCSRRGAHPRRPAGVQPASWTATGTASAASSGRPCFRHCVDRWSVPLVVVQEPGAADEAQVRIRLGMVAQVGFRAGVVFLGQQPRGAEQVHQLVKEVPGLLDPADGDVGLDQPRGADVEAALQARQAVVVPVAENGGPHPQFPLHRRDGGQEPGVVDVQQAGETDVQHGCVQVRAVVRHGVGAPSSSQPSRRTSSRIFAAVGSQAGSGSRPCRAAVRSARSSATQHITFV